MSTAAKSVSSHHPSLARVGDAVRWIEIFAFALFGSTSLSAQTWTVVNLHPAGASRSQADAVTGGRQVGSATYGGKNHAITWTGTAGSVVELHPATATDSYAVATTANVQAGRAFIGGEFRPVIWRGTAESFVTLRAAGTGESVVTGTTDSQQAGYVVVGGRYHAVIWAGSADSLVDLNPPGYQTSLLYGTNGTRQVGYASNGIQAVAGLWTRSAASFQSLHPAGAYASFALSISTNPEQQVGYVRYAEVGFPRAAVWAGSAATFVDLNPTDATGSAAFGTDGTHQVGQATLGGRNYAALWTGTAASFVDLHAFLPGNYLDSQAQGVWTDGVTTLVVGKATNADPNREEAILWRLAPLPILLPTVEIRGPQKRTTRSTRFTLQGRATNAVRVEVSTNRAYRSAQGTANWQFPLRLRPGRNRVFVRAVTAEGIVSPLRRLIFIRRS